MARSRDRNNPLQFSFELYPEHAAALRSVIEEMSVRLARKLEGASVFATEDAWTKGAVALGILRKTVNEKVPAPAPNFV